MPTNEELLQRIDDMESKLAVSHAPPANLPSDQHDAPPVDNGAGSEAEPVYSWDQLQGAVQEGKITEGVAHQIWTEQNHRRAVKEASESVVRDMTARDTATKVDAEINRYRELIPQVMDPASEQRQRVVREFNRLTGELGFDKGDLRTELASLQAAFGPVDAVAKAVKTKPEGHRDVSDDDPGAADDAKDTDPDTTPPSSLSADEKRYYQNAIQQRVYKNWGAVREELKFSTARVRRRYGARV